MNHVMKESTPDTIRMRLQILCAAHYAALRSGEEHLRAAMADYGNSLCLGQKSEGV